MQFQIQTTVMNQAHEAEKKTINSATILGLMLISAFMIVPGFAHAAVSVDRPAQAILQLLSAGFLVLGAIGVIFCCIAGIFGFAQWTKLLNIMGWIIAGAGALSLATYLGSLAV